MRELECLLNASQWFVSDRSHLHQTTAPVPVHHAFLLLAASLGNADFIYAILRKTFAIRVALGPNDAKTSALLRLQAVRTGIDGYGPLVTA